MKKLAEIKDNYAKELGYKNWESFTCHVIISDMVVNEVATRYATEVIEEAERMAQKILNPNKKEDTP